MRVAYHRTEDCPYEDCPYNERAVNARTANVPRREQ
jgi:hypothetical protein